MCRIRDAMHVHQGPGHRLEGAAGRTPLALASASRAIGIWSVGRDPVRRWQLKSACRWFDFAPGHQPVPLAATRTR